MSQKDLIADKKYLQDWLLRRAETTSLKGVSQSPLYDRVTALLYFFRPLDQVEQWFVFSAQALRETWLHCGYLRTVVVTNGSSIAVEEFAAQYPNVEVQLEPCLLPGNVDSLSIDCNARLASRFKTDYVLTVQDDGFPLRQGLERYVGRYDFIGAPWRRRNLFGLVKGTLLRDWPMNGGFSLRSKRFCDGVSRRWEQQYSREAYATSRHGDDIFCTMTLPREDRDFRRCMRWPNAYVASSFSYEAIFPSNRTSNPFGFHGANSFREIVEARKA